ncbi:MULTISPECIES: hypothetical protein [Bacillus]|nr:MULTISPECIES: hypothetical protein [Bacillus cereus group]OOG90916.1 hypothetical protein BTH41_02399 [Bacillus mycoides]MED3022541.1 hypothetical protein [Bacillus wiedmannii]OTX94632.1 hypothetical protein BK729_30725 [Bacillus thuringiensis serovar wratislaviensis]OUB56389.1 hypothetical protein BK743_22080 [Bacillus thuringiensis serovar sylvestriensis]PEK64669.1 hypothetical protein CN590_19795 [Bacillus pseudomycoides]
MGNTDVLPLSIKLLFNNVYLETANMLCVLTEFKSKKKGIRLSELLFYYVIVSAKDYEAVTEQLREPEPGKKIKTQFQRYESKMKSILINLESADYIELSASEKSDVYVKITKKGIDFVSGLEKDYFELLQQRTREAKTIPYTKKNEKTLMGDF